jgi:hypothetical protein
MRYCDIPGGTTTADAEIDASDLSTVTHVEWKTASATGAKSDFLSAATNFEVLDVDVLPPNWGEPVKGIRSGLSVDREQFAVGERIPLHIRWENTAASDPLEQGECGDPEPDVEIQDAQHNVVKTIPTYRGCNGHGWGPFEIPRGKPLHMFTEFTTESGQVPPFVTPAAPTLPGPGVYFLVSVWAPRVLEKVEGETSAYLHNGAGKIGAVYATARSMPVRIEVVPRGNP